MPSSQWCWRWPFILTPAGPSPYKNKPAEIALAGEKHRWAVYYLLVIFLLAGYIMQSGGFGNAGFGMYAGF